MSLCIIYKIFMNRYWVWFKSIVFQFHTCTTSNISNIWTRVSTQKCKLTQLIFILFKLHKNDPLWVLACHQHHETPVTSLQLITSINSSTSCPGRSLYTTYWPSVSWFGYTVLPACSFVHLTDLFFLSEFPAPFCKYLYVHIITLKIPCKLENY